MAAAVGGGISGVACFDIGVVVTDAASAFVAVVIIVDDDTDTVDFVIDAVSSISAGGVGVYSTETIEHCHSLLEEVAHRSSTMTTYHRRPP